MRKNQGFPYANGLQGIDKAGADVYDSGAVSHDRVEMGRSVEQPPK